MFLGDYSAKGNTRPVLVLRDGKKGSYTAVHGLDAKGASCAQRKCQRSAEDAPGVIKNVLATAFK